MSRPLTIPSYSPALSQWHLEKLRLQLQKQLPTLKSVKANFYYVFSLSHELSEQEKSILHDVLQVNRPDPIPEAPFQNHDKSKDLILVVLPRIGTISSFCSRAVEIIQRCGLDKVKKIERVILYVLNFEGEVPESVPMPKDKVIPSIPLWDIGFENERFDLISNKNVFSLLYDRMTEDIFTYHPWEPHDKDRNVLKYEILGINRYLVETPDLLTQDIPALISHNHDYGLALSKDEIKYLYDYYRKANKNPTDVELMMFAQANSEHCRHKIFNAHWVVNNVPQEKSLFGMIRHTHEKSPEKTVVAYRDNASIIGIEKEITERFYPNEKGIYAFHQDKTHYLIKVETHNHPTAISPFSGAGTGAGGEIRDEGATGRGAKPKAGLVGFATSHLHIPGYPQIWEKGSLYPTRIASSLKIMLDGPIGASQYQNEFGRPTLTGYFRTFEQQDTAGEMRGYHKPIMLAGGIGNISDRHTHKEKLPEGTLLIHLGGPALAIGIGGGSASSQTAGENSEDLDFNSVQRGNPELERRCQEVINRCWQLQDKNPILSIHDVGAGGLSNAFPELVNDAEKGAVFDLDKIPNEALFMSAKEIWCNEAQERYVLAITREELDLFRKICERERCPFAVVGEITSERQLIVNKKFADNPVVVNMPFEVLFGNTPKIEKNVHRLDEVHTPFDTSNLSLEEVIPHLLHFPAVTDKSFLITIGDRTVGGMTARDQMVGPWQVPVADCAVTLASFNDYFGEAFAIGERTPLALINAPASGRMAIGEAITNLISADIGRIENIKLSANWMVASGHPGEDAKLFDTVKAVAMDFCPALGISIPVGKDSMSMKTVWQEGDKDLSVTAPLSLIVSSFSEVVDVRRTLTPQLQVDHKDTQLILIDLGFGKNRMGGSVLGQIYHQLGDISPDISAEDLRAFVSAMQKIRPHVLAYHDRSDGGLIVTLLEMAFAGHCGLEIDLTELNENVIDVLCNEELGAVIQVPLALVETVLSEFNRVFDQANKFVHVIGKPAIGNDIQFFRQGKTIFQSERDLLHKKWRELSYQMQKLRDNPECAKQDWESILDVDNPGLFAKPSFEPSPFIAKSCDLPRVAILREQGVNGQTEMAAAFHRAGFESVDVTMSDLLNEHHDLKDFIGLVACGGFSYGDVLGAGVGWAKSILWNKKLRSAFEDFFNRSDTFALGVCNGCQMMSYLKEIIPGGNVLPNFSRNQSEQFEARSVMVEITQSNSLFFAGMAGSQLPIVVSHGEGRAIFVSESVQKNSTCLNYIDNYGKSTNAYPYNPNGSPSGATGFTTENGRITIMMPHPERIFRSVQNSWYPKHWGEDSPWMQLFVNARKWVG